MFCSMHIVSKASCVPLRGRVGGWVGGSCSCTYAYQPCRYPRTVDPEEMFLQHVFSSAPASVSPSWQPSAGMYSLEVKPGASCRKLCKNVYSTQWSRPSCSPTSVVPDQLGNCVGSTATLSDSLTYDPLAELHLWLQARWDQLQQTASAIILFRDDSSWPPVYT